MNTPVLPQPLAISDAYMVIHSCNTAFHFGRVHDRGTEGHVEAKPRPQGFLRILS